MTKMKIKIVYNKKNGNILPCIWEQDGTVTITTSTKERDYNNSNIIVSMVDVDRIDFDTGNVLLYNKKIN